MRTDLHTTTPEDAAAFQRAFAPPTTADDTPHLDAEDVALLNRGECDPDNPWVRAWAGRSAELWGGAA